MIDGRLPLYAHPAAPQVRPSSAAAVLGGNGGGTRGAAQVKSSVTAMAGMTRLNAVPARTPIAKAGTVQASGMTPVKSKPLLGRS